ncbi:sensor domain-containing phosphodiesterase [Massilia genomosp. 1]|uniref:EAL domain-containing protein n=1 Tax=Massilia genomosp. 1 TaxID=2609280 RepID=A0ABX0MPQ3_9BURK|nr:EAL domain-containing protein [Massilia genomosp. 1]NHZ64741.1 EAL domain-containing protein [Massilia genomosp. 1]
MNTRNETDRLLALRKLNLLDSAPTEAFDRITRMAARVFGLPIAAVSLTDSDRQWFKSRVGMAHTAIPRIKAPCASVADSGALLVIDDLYEDAFFRDSHLAHSGVRFYAGAPLTTSDGFNLGAICVLGLEPRTISATERDALTDLAAMVMAQIELQHTLGRVDPLSGMPNRKQFIEDYADLQMDRPHGEQRVAVLVNMANQEQLNNAARVMGASYFDDLVNEAIISYRAVMGNEHTVYQLAATQFITIAPPGAGDGAGAGAYRARLAHWLGSRGQWSTSRFVTTPAIGIAPFQLGRTDCLDVLRIAQNAMQDAHQTGQLIGTYSSAQDEAYRRRFTLLNAFDAALGDTSQLRLVYQPRIDLISGACIGAEALLRWRHPELGDVPPGEFIPVVEQTSMVRAATSWVLREAVRQLAAWHGAGLRLQMSVNVSAANLLEADFVSTVTALLNQHRMAPGWLELEVTESAIMENQGTALATLAALDQAGVRLAIDDFGTGYSSLSYLQSMPAHVVKIDQSFVRNMAGGERNRTLVNTMISLSHELGFRVVAEGIETDDVRQLLHDQGCDEGQGYLFARPLAPEELFAWCARAQASAAASEATARAPWKPICAAPEPGMHTAT